MWLKALTPIKVLRGAGSAVVAEGDPPFELADAAGAELVLLGAAQEVDAPPEPPPKPPAKK